MVEMVSDLAKKANVRISDEELKGAMAMYMTPEADKETEEDAETDTEVEAETEEETEDSEE